MSDWQTQELRQLADFKKGRKVELSNFPLDGFAPYLGAVFLGGGDSNVFADTHGAVLADERDVLMLWDGERSGLVGKGKSGVVSSTTMKLSPKNGIEPIFLYYALDHQFPWIQNQRTGTGVPHVPKDLGRILKLRHPSSDKEQQRIESILSKADEALEQTRALISKTQQIKYGLMLDFFTRGVTVDGKLRPTREEAPHLYKKSPLGWIPIGWSCELLDDLLAKVSCPMRSGPFGSSLLKAELVGTGVPLLGIDNVFAERFVAEYRRFVTRSKFLELSRYAVHSHDVIITIMGTVGRCCVVPDSIGEALSSKHLWTMTFDQNKVLPELMCWQLNYAPWVKEWFTRHSQGAVMDAIQSSILRTLTLPVPPIPEQILIRERYASCEAALSAERARLRKLSQIKVGLMQDLLTGPRRVTVDPTLSLEIEASV